MVDKTKTYRTKTGKVLTDADVEALADEVEGDYDVDALKTRRRGRPSMGSAAAEVVPVRLDPELKEAVEARAKRENTTKSDVIRKAIRSADGADEPMVELRELSHDLLAPPDSLPPPPVDPRAEILPLRTLQWKSFERLMVKVVLEVQGWLDVREYGISGQDQAGIDLIGFDLSKARTCQVKNVETFTAGALRNVIEKYATGRKPMGSSHIAVAVACPVEDTGVQDELFKLRGEHPELAIDLWGEKQISAMLEDKPTVVTRFFSEEWTRRFCDPALLPQSSDARAVALDQLWRESEARLTERWMAAGVDELHATELAADPSVGALAFTIPTEGAVALVGDFGSGKSVAGERMHQADVAAAQADTEAPIPILLRARDITGALEPAVRSAAADLGDYRLRGLRLVLDGLDEAGLGRGSALLADARALARASRWSRILITARPGFDFRADEAHEVPLLDDDQIADLAERIGGTRLSLYNVPAPVREAVRRPLFALIALSLQQRAQRLPESRALFIDALVRDALGQSMSSIAGGVMTLASLARATIEHGGSAFVSDLGGLDVEHELLESRLIVKHDRTVRFALPVLEQYFGAHALLRGEIALEAVVTDLEALERWRYAFVVAVGIGTWDQVMPILERLAREFPGAASWVVNEAVSKWDLSNDESASPTLPDAMECARRLRIALTAWLETIGDVADLTRLARDDRTPVTVGASVNGASLTAGLLRGVDGDPDTVALGHDVHPFSPDPGLDVGPLRGSRPPAAEPAWPWRWALEWTGDSIEQLLRSQRLRLDGDSVLGTERRYALARRLVGEHGRMGHSPISNVRAQSAVRGLLERLGEDPRTVVTFGGDNFRVPLLELQEFALSVVDPEGEIKRPWPVPDNLHDGGGWISGLYSPECLRQLVERVHLCALDAYTAIGKRFFPRWMPTLGLGGMLPIRIDIALIPRHGDGFDGEPVMTVKRTPLETATASSVVVEIVDRSDDRFGWDREKAHDAQEMIRRLRSDTAPWIHADIEQSVVSVFGDTPAADLAYHWLWNDLKNLGLLHSMPPARF